MEIIDLRSDTVTKPSREMREAMLTAEVGDDVYGEDPTVNRLQERVAEILGKEAALFVPSGVMANQLALKVHTQPGDEAIVESESHIFNYETAGAAFLSNVQLCTVKGNKGILKAEQIAQAIRSAVYYNPKTSLICLENTHNKAGGTIYPLEEIQKIHNLARTRNLALHLDGARLWNASIATGIAPKEYARYFDTVSVCFSKGLGAPVGSALTGTREKIESARKYRKIFGGGMRQVGILAAGVLFALDHNIERLKEDHDKAKWLAKELSNLPGITLDLDSVQTNILIFNVRGRSESTEELITKLKTKGVLISEMGISTLRAVTHLDVSMEQIERASETIKSLLGK
ncbi:MAG: low-specificity L-threonine aldolase [Bacteroidota bacterium]